MIKKTNFFENVDPYEIVLNPLNLPENLSTRRSRHAESEKGLQNHRVLHPDRVFQDLNSIFCFLNPITGLYEIFNTWIFRPLLYTNGLNVGAVIPGHAVHVSKALL